MKRIRFEECAGKRVVLANYDGDDVVAVFDDRTYVYLKKIDSSYDSYSYLEECDLDKDSMAEFSNYSGISRDKWISIGFITAEQAEAADIKKANIAKAYDSMKKAQRHQKFLELAKEFGSS